MCHVYHNISDIHACKCIALCLVGNGDEDKKDRSGGLQESKKSHAPNPHKLFFLIYAI